MNGIARFEAMAERLVEGTFTRLFARRISPLEVATHIARAMEDHVVVSGAGVPQAPTQYRIYLNPGDCEILISDQPDMESELSGHMAELAAQIGLSLQTAPMVSILPSEGLGPRAVRVEAHWKPEEDGENQRTREMVAAGPTAEATNSWTPPGRPFLILPSNRHVNLHQPVVSVGRSLENDVVIEDPRVSRQHAQLRQRYDRYVLYDLGSHGGTRINGYPVEECVLHSGDVISFAGVEIVYGEDPPSPISLIGNDDTPPLGSQTFEPG